MEPLTEKTIAEFLKRLIKGTEEECWNWSGDKATNGYSRLRDSSGKKVGAHRLSYTIFKGEIPEALEIDHLCRNRWCLNPAHLEAVTTKTNVLRGIGPAAFNSHKTHCIRGHPLSGGNLILKNNKRNCRICVQLWDREYQRNRRLKLKTAASQSTGTVSNTNL